MSDLFISNDQAETDMLACAAFIGERIKSSDGHAEAMNGIVPRYLAKGDVDLAAELSNAVADPFSRDKLLIVVAEKCTILDDDEYGLQLADAIEDHGMRAQAFERIGLVLAEKGKAERAAEVADSMAHPDFVYAAIAVNHAENGNDAGADARLGKVEFPSARVSAFQQIAASQIENNKNAEAIGWLTRAVATALEIEHDEEKIRALCETGNLFIEAKSNDKAIETFDKALGFAELLDNQHRDFFLVNCTLGFLNAGSIDLADRTLDLVVDKTQVASAMLGFARNHWRKDERDEALEALEEGYAILKSQRENEIRDSRSRNGLFTTIAAQFAGFAKSERGVEIALENPSPDEQVVGLSRIAEILTAQNEDVRARETVNLIADDSKRMFGLVSIADGKAKLGETASAVALLHEASALSETIPQLSARSSVLTEIVDRLADYGELEAARSLALETLSVITDIRDDSSKAISLTELSVIYDQFGLDLNGDETRFLENMARRMAS